MVQSGADCLLFYEPVSGNNVIASVSELMFLETSALTGENVEEAFVQCARKILNKIESGRTEIINNAGNESL